MINLLILSEKKLLEILSKRHRKAHQQQIGLQLRKLSYTNCLAGLQEAKSFFINLDIFMAGTFETTGISRRDLLTESRTHLAHNKPQTQHLDVQGRFGKLGVEITNASNARAPSPQKNNPVIEYGLKSTQIAKVYDTVYVGKGYSTAVSLASRANGYTSDPRNSSPNLFSGIAIIGDKSGWHKDQRGDISTNHPRQLADIPSESLGGFETEYLHSSELVAQEQKAINYAVDNGVSEELGHVQSVREIPEGEAHAGAYELIYAGIPSSNGDAPTGQTRVIAKKVILNTGVGPHAKPEDRGIHIDDAVKRAERGGKKIFDLDEFQRKFASDPTALKGKKVAIHGPNAGIDAVKTVKAGGADLVWLVGSNKPVLLADNNYPEVEAEADKTQVVDRKSLKISLQEGSNKLRLDFKSKDKPNHADEVDYYVIALGQDIHKKGAVGDLLANVRTPTGSETNKTSSNLEPLYDVNLDFGEEPYEAVLGIQTKGGGKTQGVSVEGAAVELTARDQKLNVQHTYDHNLAADLQQDFQELAEQGVDLSDYSKHLDRLTNRSINLSTDTQTQALQEHLRKLERVLTRAQRSLRESGNATAESLQRTNAQIRKTKSAAWRVKKIIKFNQYIHDKAVKSSVNVAQQLTRSLNFGGKGPSAIERESDKKDKLTFQLVEKQQTLKKLLPKRGYQRALQQTIHSADIQKLETDIQALAKQIQTSKDKIQALQSSKLYLSKLTEAVTTGFKSVNLNATEDKTLGGTGKLASYILASLDTQGLVAKPTSDRLRRLDSSLKDLQSNLKNRSGATLKNLDTTLSSVPTLKQELNELRVEISELNNDNVNINAIEIALTQLDSVLKGLDDRFHQAIAKELRNRDLFADEGEKASPIIQSASTVSSEVGRVNQYQLPTVVVSQQLGSVRSTVSAIHSAIPAYTHPTLDSSGRITRQGKVNFTADNPSVIKAFILLNYPGISRLPEAQRNGLIDTFTNYIITYRTKKYDTTTFKTNANTIAPDVLNETRFNSNNNNWGVNSQREERFLSVLKDLERAAQDQGENGLSSEDYKRLEKFISNQGRILQT